ncbi:hypothetical protein LS684_10250 [Cytobacillus spongiae]|uniref:hypothetical protein n=1 Tax=Cytobacillus spongiae TaxID=2901381 RepID=UPI001F2462B9|nr:hypothetical protein [Cytobacillus spongiae]UII57770.1 hypothetical protein LS684_10250 [Cytobacillus spongiae]
MSISDNELVYSEELLHFFRKKLDPTAISCLRLVAETKGELGIYKTKMPEFKTKRRSIELAFIILEAQGFVETRPLGNMRPYFLTVRGKQLYKLLSDEES